MANKQLLMNEIESLPAVYIDEILDYVLLVKRQKQKQSDTPVTDRLVGLLKDTGIKNADDIKDMRLGV